MTEADLWGIVRLGPPALSPDGSRAVAEVTRYDLATNGRTVQLWIFPTDGKAPWPLTAPGGQDRSPCWSPDGRRVAFIRKGPGDAQPQVYVLATDGGEARRLTSIPTGAYGPRWFPDGKGVAFLSDIWPGLDGDGAQAARLEENARSPVKALRIETTFYRYWDHWIADGRVPVLFRADLEAGTWRNLLAGTGLHLIPQEVSEDLYDIAPDGREVAITADLSRDPGFAPNPDIVAVPLDGRPWRNLSPENPGVDTSPRYAPDGSAIAWLRQTIPAFYADRVRVVLHDRGKGSNRVLTEDWDRSAGPLRWTPDSRSLCFAAEDKGRSTLFLLDRAGGAPRVLAAGATLTDPDIRGGRVAYLEGTTSQPPRLMVRGLEGPAKRLDGFNDDLLAGLDLGRVEEAWIPGWNAEPIQIFVIYPPGFDPARRWPLLQMVHGGPHNAALDEFGFRWNPHLLAARGYVVLSVNYHGSSGMGQTFTDSITGRYGERDLVDLEKATDHLLSRGFIDPDRLAAAGASYGGFLMAYMNGHTSRYKAMVCHAGVYDWNIHMATDLVRGRDRALGAWPWEDPARIRAESGSGNAASFHTPTLVVVGELDARVNPAQGLAYYNTLRMLGVESRLLYFPDEGHWILKPRNHQLWMEEIQDWIGRFVKPGGR
jgi:dipeptidyl aminopeptidase/acylaminoacyl peptidase